MNRATKRNFHLPLEADLYDRLRDEADRAGRPATDVARQALDDWLKARRRQALRREIAEFAARAAGTPLDLDPGLEGAGIEIWLEEDRA